MKLNAPFIILLFLFCSCSKTEIADLQNHSFTKKDTLIKFDKISYALNGPVNFFEPYTEVEVKNKVKELIALVGRVDLDDVKDGSSLTNDLGFGEIDFNSLEQGLRNAFNTSELTFSDSSGATTVEDVIRDALRYVVPTAKNNTVAKSVDISTFHDYFFDNLEGFPIAIKSTIANSIDINLQFISYEISWTDRLIGVKASQASGSIQTVKTIGNIEYTINLSLRDRQSYPFFRANSDVKWETELSLLDIKVLDKSTNKLEVIDSKNRKIDINLSYDVETGNFVPYLIGLPTSGGNPSGNLPKQDIVRTLFAEKIDLTSRNLNASQLISEFDLSYMQFTELEWTEFIMALENEFDIEINDEDAERLTIGSYGNLVNYVLRKAG